MQCQSYLTLYHSHNDLNVDANGSKRPLYTSHTKPQTGHFNQNLLNFGVTEGHFQVYDREFMREAMLQQEVTFKNQVHELHRLYRRQRELLDEAKRANSYKKNVLSEVQWLPNSLASTAPFSLGQKLDPVFAFGANTATASHVSAKVRNSNVLDLSLTRREPLDLQLPADEFINKFAKSYGVYRACPITPMGNASPFFIRTNPVTVSSNMVDCPDKKKLKMGNDLIETDYLNGTLWLQHCGKDESSGKSMSSLNSWYSYSESLQRLAEAGQAHQTAPLFTKNIGRLENERRHKDGKILGSIHDMLDLNRPISEFPATNSADNETPKHTNRMLSIDLNCSGDADLEEVSANSFSDLRVKADEVVSSSGAAPEENLPNAGKHRTGQNKKSFLFDINLPCQSETDEVEADIKASMMPISPEKKECPRPRGESLENETEASLKLCTREDEDESMKLAADVLVSISSFEAQKSSTVSEKCLDSDNELLSWFAGVVCLTEQEDVGIDEFEAMTLKLTEKSVQDYSYNAKTRYNDNEMYVSSKGRTTKRAKRKNFQREVLPSLASLSKYEVSEDIQVLESLMETAGTPLQKGVKTRKFGGKRKTHVKDGRETMSESRICLLALSQTGNSTIGLNEKGCFGWENMRRQPRGKRCRNVLPSSNLSQEGWMKKWGGIGFVQEEQKKIKQVEILVPQVA